MSAKSRSTPASWAGIIKTITTPLGFYVLALLIVETTLALVLRAQLDSNQRYTGFLWMIGIFIGVVVIVTLFAIFNPKNLLYGKEEHSAPQIEPSALRDQIEDIISERVKSESLKNPPTQQ